MFFTAPERSARATPDSTGSTLPLVETRLEMLSRDARAKVTCGGRPRWSSSFQNATPAMARTIRVSQRRLDFMEYTTVSHAGVSAFRRRLVWRVAGRRVGRAEPARSSGSDRGRL